MWNKFQKHQDGDNHICKYTYLENLFGLDIFILTVTISLADD